MFIIPKGTGDYYLYFLRLKHGYFYVGITKDLRRRIWQHCGHEGSGMTRRHQPLELIAAWYLGDMSYEEAEYIEDEFTLYFMKNYSRRVRGGKWCKERIGVKKILKRNPAYCPCNLYELVSHNINLSGKWEHLPIEGIRE